MPSTTSTPLAYARDHQAEAVTQLKDWLTIPSVSRLDEHKPDMTRAADWLAEHMRRMGLENVAVLPTEGFPVVYGDWLHAEGAPTVLVYGHYDVQPVDPLELWTTPPFEPTLRNGRLYARGAQDKQIGLLLGIAQRSSVRQLFPRPQPTMAELAEELL